MLLPRQEWRQAVYLAAPRLNVLAHLPVALRTLNDPSARPKVHQQRDAAEAASHPVLFVYYAADVLLLVLHPLPPSPTPQLLQWIHQI